MRRNVLLRLFLAAAVLCILLPAAVLVLWSAAARWSWPSLLPERWSARTVRELLFGSQDLWRLLGSSMSLGSGAAGLSTLIGLLTARAVSLYDFPGKGLVRFAGLLPLLIPGTVFATGIHLVLLRLGLADTAAGVLLVHVMTALPYSIAILTDVTAALGGALEEQAAVLGAGPVRAFFAISLPELMPGVLSSLSMAFILSYSQYFTTLIVGGGRVKTLALVMVPYIQGGDRSLASVYALAFTGSALLVSALFEALIRHWQKRGDRL